MKYNKILQFEKRLNLSVVIFMLVLFLFIFSFVFYTIHVSMYSFFKFILATIFLFYIPGMLFLKLLKIKFTGIAKLAIDFSFGIVSITILYFLLGLLKLQNYFIIIPFIFALLFLVSIKKENLLQIKNYNFKLNIKSVIFLLLIILILFSIASTSFPSGLLYKDGLRFYEMHANDSLSRLAVTAELTRSIPPQLPTFSGELLQNYYYFPNLFIVIYNKTFDIDILELYFRFVPLTVFFILSLLIFLTIKYLTKNEVIALLALFLFFFIDDFAYIPSLIATLLINPAYIFHRWESLLWTSTISHLHWNYPIMFALIMFFAGFYSLIYYVRNKFSVILPAIFFGSLIQYKGYYSIITLLSLSIIGTYFYAKKRNLQFLKIFFYSSILTAILILPSLNLSKRAFSLSFAYGPLNLLPRVGIISAERLQSVISSNIFLAILIYLILILIFLIAVFGIEIFSFKILFAKVKNYKKLESYNFFLIICILLGIIIPLFFIINIEIIAYDTLGFLLFSKYLLIIFLAIFLYNLIKTQKITNYIFFFLIILAGVIGPLHFIVFNGFDFQGYSVLSKEEYNAMLYLRENSLDDSIILHNFKDLNYNNDPTLYKRTKLENSYAFIEAIAQRRSVLGSENFAIVNFVQEEKIKERKSDVNLFFTTQDMRFAKGILNKYNVNYIYTLKNNKESQFSNNLLPLFDVFYENSEVIIYKVK